MNEPLFQANKLTYKNNLIYDKLKIEKNKINFIVGESGCGKSTFLKLLNHTISPTSGELLYKGKAIETYDPITLRRDVSLISQETFLFNESILDNFKTFYSMRQVPMPSMDYIKYITALCCVNVPLDQNASTLSGGERQRVYISIFLSLCPKVLLLGVLKSRKDLNTKFKIAIGASLTFSGIFVLVFFVTIIVNKSIFNPQYTIPLAGMIIGNAMTGINIGVKTFMDSISKEKNKINALLNLGIDPKDILRPFVNNAFETALIPTLNSMLGMGIIFLPGMMTGQILSGTLPKTAIMYQIAIMIAICTSVCMTVFLALNFGYKSLYNTRKQFI